MRNIMAVKAFLFIVLISAISCENEDDSDAKKEQCEIDKYGWVIVKNNSGTDGVSIQVFKDTYANPVNNQTTLDNNESVQVRIDAHYYHFVMVSRDTDSEGSETFSVAPCGEYTLTITAK